SMSILRPFLSRVIRYGQLTILAPNGGEEVFGVPTAGYANLTVRFTSKRAMRHVVLDPRLGAAEAFMDGDLIIENGDIMDLIHLLRANTPWDRGEKLKDLT